MNLIPALSKFFLNFLHPLSLSYITTLLLPNEIIANYRFRNALEWRLLLLDGHESHCNYPFIDIAWRYRILIFVLPAHSSHLTQPLDVGLFSPLQHYYVKLLDEWFQGGYPSISREDFIPLLKRAKAQTYTLQNIQGAWRGTGLVPYDRRKVQGRLEKSASNQE
jgi:hypothetical protein